MRGWRTSRKLIVFESDDWGAIRMPNRAAYDSLLMSGIRVDRSPYDRLDCLERRTDFEGLMNVLLKHKDSEGNPPIFTINTIMGNPDFEAIRRDRFERYHHMNLFDSYRYYHGESLEGLWRESMRQGLIRPQFHGREHLNVPLWLKDLRNGYEETRRAFSHGYYGLTTTTSAAAHSNYLAAFMVTALDGIDDARSRLQSGLDMFARAFGYRSLTFIPCNYIFPAALRAALFATGVRLVQAQRGQFVPLADGNYGRVQRFHTGMVDSAGLLYTVRNVKFEPFECDKTDWVLRALWEVQEAFLLRRPAIISTHRVNYVSGLDRFHGVRSLRLLEKLLTGIRHRWPSVEFVSSDQLLQIMERH